MVLEAIDSETRLRYSLNIVVGGRGTRGMQEGTTQLDDHSDKETNDDGEANDDGGDGEAEEEEVVLPSSSTAVVAVAAAAAVAAASPEDVQRSADLDIPADMSTTALALYIRQNVGTLYQDGQYMASIAERSNNTKQYGSTQERVYTRFISSLRKHVTLNFLAELKNDPEAPDKYVEEIILVCRGTPSYSKKEVLNCAMKVFDQDLYLMSAGENVDMTNMSAQEKAKLEYQPSSLQTLHKQLFSLLKQKGVMLEQKMFTNFPASYKMALKDRIQSAARIRPEYGRLPNQAPVDLDEAAKLRQRNWNLNDFVECQEIFLFVTATIFMLRGSKEVHSLRFEDFVLGIKKSGPHTGDRYLEILPLHAVVRNKIDQTN